MKTNNRKISTLTTFVLSLFFLALVIQSCSDDSTPPVAVEEDEEEETVIDTPENSIRSIQYAAIWKAEFQYKKGEIAHVIWDDTDTMKLTYTNGRITREVSKYFDIPITYDQMGRVVEFSWGSPGTQRIEYFYTGSDTQPSSYNWLTKKFKDGSWTEDSTYTIRNIKYDSEGGIISCDVRTYSNSVSQLSVTVDLDSKMNPMYGNIPYHTAPYFGDAAYGLTKISKKHINKLNVKQNSSNSWEVKILYEWEPGLTGYPNKITYSPDSGPRDWIFKWNKK